MNTDIQTKINAIAHEYGSKLVPNGKVRGKDMLAYYNAYSEFVKIAKIVLNSPELLREHMEGFATWISDNQVSILNHDEWLALKINKKINRFSELFDLYIEHLKHKI